MNIDCRWIEENLEAFFCERLAVEETHIAQNHVDNCVNCREKVAAIRSVDPLIQRFFQHEMAIARAPKRRRSPVLLGAFATAIAAVIVVVAWRIPQAPVAPVALIATPPVVVSSSEQLPAPAVPKISAAAPQERAKPEPVAPDKATPAVNNGVPPATNDSRPEFLVTDAAGYSRTLKDYRGHILIFGVWSGKEPKTVASLEQIYQTFGPNTKLRILGVALRHESKPEIATFPIVYNQESTLLGTKQSEFIVVDGEGTVRARGSLLQEPNAVEASIRSALSKIN